jgi:hypothetical protein
MKAIALFARTTIVGGVFFLAPIVVLIVILAKAFGFAKTGLQAVVVRIPGVLDLSVGVATALSIAMITLVCLLAGLVAHTLIAQRFVNALESSGRRSYCRTAEQRSRAFWRSPRARVKGRRPRVPPRKPVRRATPCRPELAS